MKITESSAEVKLVPRQNIYVVHHKTSPPHSVTRAATEALANRVALKGVDTAWHDAGRQPLFIVRAAAIHNGENDEMLPL